MAIAFSVPGDPVPQPMPRVSLRNRPLSARETALAGWAKMDVSQPPEGRTMLSDRYGQDFDGELDAECDDELIEFL